MRYLAPIILATGLVVSSCASFSEQVLKEAVKIPVFKSTYVPATGSEFQWAYDELWGRLEAAGAYVEEIDGLVNPSTGAKSWGLTFRGDHHIDIEKSVDVNARLEILAHEAGHLFHNGAVSTSEAEVFAELVGANVLAHYGFPGAKEKSAQYLASYKYGFASLPFVESDIDLAVKALIGQIEWHVDEN